MSLEPGQRVYLDWPPHLQGTARVEVLHADDQMAAVRMEVGNALRVADLIHLTPIPEEHPDAQQDQPQG